jgi:hypothetical protein
MVLGLKASVFQVEYEDFTEARLIQSGFLIRLQSSHDAVLDFQLNSDAKITGSVKITAGTNQFCVPKPGTYTLRPMSCFKFDEETYEFNTAAPSRLHLNAVDYRVSGRIVLDKDSASEAGETINLRVRKVNDEAIGQESFQLVEASLSRKNPSGSSQKYFDYSFWASFGDKFEVSPLVTKGPHQSSTLYYPKSRHVSIDSKGCPPPIEAFTGRKGKFLSGKVTPAISGVKIVIESSSMSEAPVTISADSNGVYSAGPLYDDEEYTVSAWRKGYHFIEDTPGNFRALKLTEIQIKLVDSEGQPLSGVLVSLSGDGYRSSNITEDDGRFTFSGLFPGTYYLRPLLKEYEFQPNFKPVSVVEGATVEETFIALRVAYSVFGTVISLSGAPEKGVSMEAVSPEGHREETATDSSGNYRIRGLKPNTDYAVRNKGGSSNPRVDRSIPKSSSIHVGVNDTFNMDFVVFHKLSTFDIAGRVVVDQKWMNTLTVSPICIILFLTFEFQIELLRSGDLGKIISSIKLTSNLKYFDFPFLTPGDYVVRLKTSLSSRTYSFPSELKVVVHLKDNHEFVELAFSAEPNVVSEDLTQGSFLSLVFGILIVLSVFYRSDIQDFVTRLANPSPASSSESGSGSDWMPQTNSKKGHSRRGSQASK